MPTYSWNFCSDHSYQMLFQRHQRYSHSCSFFKKAEEKEPFFTQEDLKRSGDPRFSLENLAVGPSLQISDTMFSDEGKYMYRVVTDSGFQEIQLSISVTGEIQFL